MSDAPGSEFNLASEYEENLVTKGVVESSESTKLVEISRSRDAKVIGEGVYEGHVRDGVRVKMGKRFLNFAEKIFNSDFFLDSEAKKQAESLQKIINNHIRLKKLGFPVINTMRLIDTLEGSEKRLLVTDLSENGKNLVLSATTQDFHKNLELSNPQEVNQELLEICELLNLNSVSLGNYDVPFLVVDKETKRGKIILGDLEQVSFMEKDEFVRESTENHNLSILQDFAWLINHKFLVNGELEIKPKTLTR